ncbi:hypothetical protein B9G98_04441 [Wickerhamiella sorbophila]|uniref:Myosin-binding domain-containing protein n=1 Tax=Wickerhamiella sorbophila TaxID=45607 RepID=A0A2T0FPA5_9ASCO|nr:hypothetical protein B9G98_04441 [Wickerhamiella sorbophila]PRT56821.1 hypothetical protein B9G98_04441 [Wickerhamiella sorbophila]
MPEAVFGNTPLADYLSDAGMEDWGIEEDVEAPSTSVRPEKDKNGLYPLVLTEGRELLRQHRFRGLIRQAVTSHIGHHEVKRFLEQFRYCFVSSQLLESRPLYATWSVSSGERRTDILFSSDGPWNSIKLQKKFFVGGGGCIVVVAVLVYWRSRKEMPNSPVYTNCALIATLLVGLYLYAHSRRRILRRLYAKALAHETHFVNASKVFDGDVVRALRQIQEVDIVSRSMYVEDTNTGREYPNYRRNVAAKKLRAVLASALYLSEEGFLDAIKDCLCMSSELDIQQYFEVYDLAATQQELGFVMNDDYIGFDTISSLQDFHGATACSVPLTVLKHQFRRVHFLRRAFICCLLCASSTGECTTKELEQWTVITDHLASLADLTEQLSRMICKERLEPQFEAAENSPFVEKTLSRNMFDFSVVAQTLAARMEVVQQTPADSQESLNQLNLVRDELSRLNDLWRAVQPDASSTETTPIPKPDLIGLGLRQVREFDDSADLEYSYSSMSTISAATTLQEEDNRKLQVLEAVVEGKQPSMLSRDERIRLARQRRQEGSKKSFGGSQQDAFMVELESVLARRV